MCRFLSKVFSGNTAYNLNVRVLGGKPYPQPLLSPPPQPQSIYDRAVSRALGGWDHLALAEDSSTQPYSSMHQREMKINMLNLALISGEILALEVCGTAEKVNSYLLQ